MSRTIPSRVVGVPTEAQIFSNRRTLPFSSLVILQVPPQRTSRFGSALVLSRVHWVRPELVVEVKYLSWTDDNLLRQVIYQGLREDKPAAEVRRSVPHPEPEAATSTKVRARRPQ
jgi:ATP dependent DNA ligase C terminal region